MYVFEFRKIGIDAPNKTTGNTKVVCPKCVDRKGGRLTKKDLSINYDKGLFKCHSASCGWSGSVARLKETFSRPEWKNKTTLSSNVVKYFETRGISQNTLDEMKITTSEKGAVEFNYFRGDELVNVKSRWMQRGKKFFAQHPGAEKILYNVNSLIGKKKAIIVEGEMDVLSWIESGIGKEYGIISVDQGAGIPGTSLDGKLECFTNCADELDQIDQFYICTDKDAPGVYLQQEIIRRLGEYRCFIVDLPEGSKDANDILDSRKNGLSDSARKETLRLQLRTARPVPVPGIKTLDEEMEEQMLKQFREGRETGKTTHFPVVDEYYTFLKGDLTLIIGLPGDGKSNWERHTMVIKSKYDNWKWACYVPEDLPEDVFFDDLIHVFVGKSPYKHSPNQMSEAEYMQGILFVRDHFYCIVPPVDEKTGQVRMPSNKWLNKMITFLKLKYGVNAYIKDPWNKIYHNFEGMREDQYLAQEISREKFFAATYDAAVYVAHPSKLQKTKEGKYPCPDVYDISGGAMFNNMMDNIISIYRPNRTENPSDKMVEVHSKKIKKQKLVGKLGHAEVYYEASRNRYYQYVDDFNPLESKESPSLVDDDDMKTNVPDQIDEIPF